jgi:hypothetical protein
MLQLALAVAGGLAVGASLGFLGGGGTMLTLPLLLALGTAPKAAIALSLAVVAATAALAAARHARAGNVDWRSVALFGPATVAGGFAGGRAAGFVSGEALLLAFTGLMVAAGVAMLRARPLHAGRAAAGARPLALLVLGAAIGAVTGLVGAGGGFLFVPSLALFGGLAMRCAIGTSLVLIAANSCAALLGHLAHVRPDLGLAGAITAAAAVGAWLGVALAGRAPEATLRPAFGVFVLAVAAWMLARSPLLRAWLGG